MWHIQFACTYSVMRQILPFHQSGRSVPSGGTQNMLCVVMFLGHARDNAFPQAQKKNCPKFEQ